MLLRKAGVAPALLPLLAEPARASVRGLAITARRRRPAYICAYLAALKEIAAGCTLDAAAVLADTQQVADRIQEEVGRRRAALDGDLPMPPGSDAQEQDMPEEGNVDSGKKPSDSHGDAEQDDAAIQALLEQTTAATGVGDGNAKAGREAFKKAEEYFRHHLEQKKRAQEEAADADAAEDDDGEQPGLRVVWGEEEWATADSRRQRIHAIATIASAALEASAQLLASQSLQVNMLDEEEPST